MSYSADLDETTRKVKTEIGHVLNKNVILSCSTSPSFEEEDTKRWDEHLLEDTESPAESLTAPRSGISSSAFLELDLDGYLYDSDERHEKLVRRISYQSAVSLEREESYLF